MALWQWDTWIVPKTEIKKRFEGQPESMDLNAFEDIGWWDDVSGTELIEFFSSILPDYQTPWAKYSQSWGSDDGDRATLMVEEGRISDVFIRVDVRDLNIDFLESLVNFARTNDFLFFPIESRKFIEPKLSELLFEIQTSRKSLFVSNPAKFFADKEYLELIDKENRDRILKK